MPATFKAPTGAKHDRCIDHVPHAYPKSGKLCIGPAIGEAGMIAFADHLALVAAEHRAADGARVEAMHLAARPGAVVATAKRSTGRKRRSLVMGAYSQPEHTIGQSFSGSAIVRTTAADAAKLAELVARFRAMRGLPAEAVEPVAVSLARKAASRAPRPEPIAERRPWTSGPERAESSRCWHYLHTSGVAPIRCSVEPDLHDGPHDYGIVAEPVAPDPMTICNGCDAAPADPGSAAGYCSDCELAARQSWRESVAELTAEPVTAETPGAVLVLAEPASDQRSEWIEPTTHPYRFDDTVTHPGASRIDCAECHTHDPAPVLSAPSPSPRPTCERCEQSFRKSGSGLAWHLANRLDCARVAVAV